MAYTKNRYDRLRITFDKETEAERKAKAENQISLNIQPDTEEFISPRDALESLCKQRKSSFKEFENLFNWFIKEDNLYAISKRAFVDVSELKQLSHEDIIAYLKGRFVLNYQCYHELGTNFHFFNSIEPYRLKTSKRKSEMDRESVADTLYEIALTQMDHR